MHQQDAAPEALPGGRHALLDYGRLESAGWKAGTGALLLAALPAPSAPSAPPRALRRLSSRPRTIGPDALAAEAAALMERHRITSVLVVDEAGTLVGALNTNDLLRAKVI